LRLFVPAAVQHPDGFGHLLQALDVFCSRCQEVALVGDDLAALRSAVHLRFRPRVVVAGGPEGTETPELMRGRTQVDGSPAAYVCESFSCKMPVTEPAELAMLLDD